MKIQQKADSDQDLVKSVHCKQLGLVQIIKYRTHVIKGKKQIGTAVNMPQYGIIGHNTSFARFFIIFFSAVLQAHIKGKKVKGQLTRGLQTKLNWTSSKRDTRIVAMSLSKEFEEPWRWQCVSSICYIALFLAILKLVKVFEFDLKHCKFHYNTQEKVEFMMG